MATTHSAARTSHGGTYDEAVAAAVAAAAIATMSAGGGEEDPGQLDLLLLEVIIPTILLPEIGQGDDDGGAKWLLQ